MSTLAIPYPRITSPSAFAAILPTLVGFTPEESLVVVFVKRDLVVVTLRIDLADIDYSINDYVVSTARRVDADTALVATYTGNVSDPRPCRSLVLGMSAALSDAGVHMRDALSIIGNKYWSYICQDPQCCNPQGTRVLGGFAVSRNDIVARYAAHPELSPSHDLLERAASDADPDILIRSTAALEMVQQLATTACGVESGDIDVLRARLLVWCQHVHVRDFVLCSIAACDDRAGDMVECLAQTALRAPLGLRPRVAGMASALLAAFGSSTIPASCLVDLAGQDSLADLVRQSITAAVPPHVLRDMFATGLPHVLDAIHVTQHP